MMRRLSVSLLVVFAVGVGCDSGGCSSDDAKDEESTEEVEGMRAPSAFESIGSERKRARAIFEEMGQVLQHPRCVNCHPAGDEPLQGERGRPHQPMVERGKGGMGPAGMRCNNCHGSKNFRNVPGEAGWRLAPAEQAWEGKSLGEICEQIKDPERNGGKSMEELVEHLAEDELVAYGWNPPDQYEPVPGSHDRFGELAQAWADAGAHCPEPGGGD